MSWNRLKSCHFGLCGHGLYPYLAFSHSLLVGCGLMVGSDYILVMFV